MKNPNGSLVVAGTLGFVLGMMFTMLLYENSSKAEPECKIVKEEIWAFQQCLKFQPACHVNGPESFATYHRNKDWVLEHCDD